MVCQSDRHIEVPIILPFSFSSHLIAFPLISISYRPLRWLSYPAFPFMHFTI